MWQLLSYCCVIRRTGGLEVPLPALLDALEVIRRIGGLEEFCQGDYFIHNIPADALRTRRATGGLEEGVPRVGRHTRVIRHRFARQAAWKICLRNGTAWAQHAHRYPCARRARYEAKGNSTFEKRAKKDSLIISALQSASKTKVFSPEIW